MEIAHKTNTLECFYKHYYDYKCRFFEIDVQHGNDTIIVYHDDFNKVSIPVITLEEFLRFTPNLITINIEIKKYNLRNINLELIELLAQHPFKKYILSSFDKDVCKELLHCHYPVFHLLSTIENYDKSFVNICIHKNLLNILNHDNHEQIYVYDVHKKELEHFQYKYPSIKAWIIDWIP
jgi:glycerophosphoryl diester phosphodiesterase